MPRWSKYIPYPPRVTDNYENPGITPKQLVYLLLDIPEALYGGAAGGGKSEALLLGALQDVEKYPVSGLLLRRTYRDLDKPGGLMFRAREWLRNTDASWDGVNYRWLFPSGASLNFGYIDSEGDELKFQSSEYQYVGFDELTHFPEHHYLYLYSRLRRLRGTPVKLRLRAGTNPGGPGHEWVRKRFNLPTGTHPSTGRVFISAHLQDNPFLEQEEYEQGLMQLGDLTRAQLLEGDWTATSHGGFFDVSQFKYAEWEDVPGPENVAAIVRYWDFAATEKSDLDPDPDYTVGLKLLQTVRSRSEKPGMSDYYILDVKRFRKNPGRVEAEIKNTAQRDGLRVPVWLEQERGAAGKLVTRHFMHKVLPSYTVRPQFVQGSKETNARIAATRVSEGNVYLVRGDWNQDFLAELGIFPLGSHDDQVDAFSNAMKAIDKERFMVDSGGTVERRGSEYRKVQRRGKKKLSDSKAYGY